MKIGLTAALLGGFALAASGQTGTGSAAADGPARVAVIAFQAVVTQTNEFQRNFADLQHKYEPKRQELKTLSGQIETLQKQLQSQGATLSEAERADKVRTLSEKQKQLQRDQEDDQNDFQQDMQQTFNGVASKVGETLMSYSAQHGYTLVLDGGDQQTQMVLYHNPATDISQAVLDAYNTKSGVPAPAQPAAGAAPRTPAKPPVHTPAAHPQH